MSENWLMPFFQECPAYKESYKSWSLDSVTRLGDLLDFGQVFKAFGNN